MVIHESAGLLVLPIPAAVCLGVVSGVDHLVRIELGEPSSRMVAILDKRKNSTLAPTALNLH